MTLNAAKKSYVLGFAFNADRTHVLLVDKNRPEWQAGKLNGIGGKIEPGEEPIEAMIRECFEESGVSTDAADWHHYLNITAPDYIVHAYRLFDDAVLAAETMTDEAIILHEVTLDRLRETGSSNLAWLIAVALDARQPEFFIEASYAA